jgi:hypothetical protein
MSESTTKQFMVLYLAPPQVLSDWAKTDPAIRKAAEESMRSGWDRWMRDNAKMLRITEAAGKTKLVSAAGISDTQNDIMLYSIVQADSHESVAQAFAKHPHLGIPQASIQVMEVRPLGQPG